MDKQLQFMISKGIDVHVIMPNDGFYFQKVLKREKNVIFHEVPLKRDISIKYDLISLIKIISILIDIKPDIIHLHTPKASLLGAIAGKVTFHKNIIYQMHGLVSSGDAKKGLIYFMEKLTCYMSSRVYAVSNSLMEYAVSMNYVSKKKISVIGNGTINGIDSINRFNRNLVDKQKYKLEEKFGNDSFLVGFVGRINNDKGIKEFVKVIQLLLKNIPVKAIVLGTNEIGPELNEIIRDNSKLTNNIFILDEVQDPENVMYIFDVLLLPTKREGFGLVAAEANSLKIPVVSYDIPGIRDSIDNHETGELVNYLDVQNLERSVLEYYNNPKKRKEHGINGRKRVQSLFNQEYLWNEIYSKYKKM